MISGWIIEICMTKLKLNMKIQDIDETFDIILLADSEFFEDSIILLKDALCWQYQDMINFQLNSKKTETKSSLSLAARNALNGKIWFTMQKITNLFGLYIFVYI
jgi:hypothetical protein